MTTRILSTLAALGLNMALAASADAGSLRDRQGPYEVEVLEGGAPLRTFSHDGETFVLGQHGDRYTLRVVNHSGRRIEAVVSVDGRDVVDGRPGDYRSKRGYLVEAYGQVDIEGWRLSQGQAAAFRFSTVADSYAARSGGGREVGVIGVAVFPERIVPPPRPVYVAPPCCARGEDDYGPYGSNGYGHGAPAAKADSAASEAAPPPARKMAPAPSSPPVDLGKDKSGGVLAERERARVNRPGLGTAFGESVEAPVYEVNFVRQSPGRPAALLGVRYNDHDGLVAMGVDVDGWRRPWDDADARRTADPFPVVERRYASPPQGWDGR